MNSNLTKVDIYKAVLSDTKEIIGKTADKDLKKELFISDKDLLEQIDLYKKAFINSNSQLFFSEFMINFLDNMENCLISFQEIPGRIRDVDENDIYSSYVFLWCILYQSDISKIEDIQTFKYDNMAKFSAFLNKLGNFVKIKENYEKYVIGIINGEISPSKAKNFFSRLLENGELTAIKKKKKHCSKRNKTKKVEEKKEVTNEPNEENKEEDKIEVKKEKGEANKEKDEDQKEENIKEDETKKRIKEYGEINEERGKEDQKEKTEEEIKEKTNEKGNENEEDKESIKRKDDNAKEAIKEGEDVFEEKIEKEKEEKEEKEREDNSNIKDNEKRNNNNLVYPQEEKITHDQLVLIVKSLQGDLDSTKQKLSQHELRIKNLEENQKLLFYQLSKYQA